MRFKTPSDVLQKGSRATSDIKVFASDGYRPIDVG